MSDDAPFALILAGGSGTRFWPVSRNARPKQLLNLLHLQEGTLLEKTVDRLHGLVPRERILVLTNVEQESGVRELLEDLPAENIIAEPAKRDTAPAIALAAGWVTKRNPKGVMLVLPADHLIRDVAGFQAVLRNAIAAAGSTDALVTIGIKPTWPCPSYGYIQRKGKVDLSGIVVDMPVFQVERFREKPEPEVAQSFLDQGFTWNGGMFIWSVDTVRSELEIHVPELAAFIGEVAETDDLTVLLEERFATLPKISIDFALMEKASRVLNLEATFDWDDVGSWVSLSKYLPEDARANRVNCPISQIESANNVVYSTEDRHIALLGVDDLIVVQTGDALLIAKREKADAIKDLVDAVPKHLH